MNNTCRKSTGLFPITFSWLFTCAQGIAGVWNGTFHVQSNDLPIVFLLFDPLTSAANARLANLAERR